MNRAGIRDCRAKLFSLCEAEDLPERFDPGMRRMVASANSLRPRNLLRAGITVAVIFAAVQAVLHPNVYLRSFAGVLGIGALLVGMLLLRSVVSFLVRRGRVKTRAQKAVEACINQRCCAACGYDMAGLKPEPEGVSVCPECGAAWRFPDPATAPTTP